MRYIVEPHRGINGVLIGSNRQQVRQVIGEPEASQGRKDSYDEYRLQIYFDRHDTVEFLELYADDPECIVVVMYGLDVFATPKHELDGLIFARTGASVNTKDEEYPCVYTYPDLSLSFWSDSDPSLFSEQEKIDFNDDFQNSHFFKSVGIGRTGYFQQ